MDNYFQGKRILVIGGTGFIGSELIKHLIKNNPLVIRIFSRDDGRQAKLQNEIGDLENLRFLIGDIRDKERLKKALEDIDIVFHVAGMKNVYLSEYNPFEAVLTNVIGTQNLIDASLEKEVEKVIFVSMNNAANPVSTLGATKLLAEKLMISAHYHRGRKRTLFSNVRLGNVFDNSYVESLKKQIVNNNSVSIPSSEIYTFVMDVFNVANLLLNVVGKMQGGETYVFKMPVVRADDLAKVTIEEICKSMNKDPFSVVINQLGLLPGEKHNEFLITNEEGKNTLDVGDMFVILSPLLIKDVEGFNYFNSNNFMEKGYSSHDKIPLTKEQIRDLLFKQV